jgi:endonuclease YncB( thermonuclease family)
MVINRKNRRWGTSSSSRSNWRRPGPRQRWLGLAALVLVLLALQWLQHRYWPPNGPVPADPVRGHPRLVDGDSFSLAGEEVRLVGIDAPEGRQTCMRNQKSWPCGEDARRELARLIAGRVVVCRAAERDQHGRLLGICSVGDQVLNRDMVASGLALAYGNYEKEEAAARAARRGLWAGEFERPKAWRRQHGGGGE